MGERRLSPRGLLGPIFLGIGGAVLALFGLDGVGVVALIFGFGIGYADSAPLFVRRQASPDA